MVADAQEKYVMAISYAMAAFDNLWWPSVEELKRRNCPYFLTRMIADYLTGKSLTLMGNYIKVEKLVSKGCPQGSSLSCEI